MAKSLNPANAHQIRPHSLVPGTIELDAAGPTPHVRSRRGSEIAWSGSWGGPALRQRVIHPRRIWSKVRASVAAHEGILGESIFNASRHLSVTRHRNEFGNICSARGTKSLRSAYWPERNFSL